MLTQQDIYAASSETRPPMLNKDNYVPWSSRLLRYAKSKHNGKLLINSINNGPYVRRIIHEPDDPNSVPPIAASSHEQTDDELTDKEAKQVEADDQAIRTILMMKGSTIGAQEKKAKLFNEWEKSTSTEGESIESYYRLFSKLMNDFSREKHFPEKIASNLEFLNNLQPEWNRSVTVVHQTKNLYEVDYTQLYDFLKFNQAENYMRQPMPNLEDISDPTTAMNTALVLIAKAFKLNYSTPTNNNQRISSNPRNRESEWVQCNTQCRESGIANPNAIQNGNGNVVAARAEGNGNRNNGNRIKCYICRGFGHLARNCSVKPRRRDAAYLQTQLLIAQKEEAWVQLQAEVFDLMAATVDIDKIVEVNAKCILMANLQQASTSAVEVEKVNMVNRKLKETNTDLTIELARYKGQEKSFEINKAKFDELETGYGKKINCFSSSRRKEKLKFDFKIREDELLDKLIQSDKKIKELDNILVKMGQSIQTMHMLTPKPNSVYHTEQKMALGYQNPFYLKQAQQKQQSLYNGRVLLEKHDPPAMYDSEETLQLAQESHLKMQQLNKEIKPANYAKINKLSEVFVS
ncbi:retrovirus-related pol polyprotein from transposon TNT 1-94 [Tanacetum coccineum]